MPSEQLSQTSKMGSLKRFSFRFWLCSSQDLFLGSILKAKGLISWNTPFNDNKCTSSNCTRKQSRGSFAQIICMMIWYLESADIISHANSLKLKPRKGIPKLLTIIVFGSSQFPGRYYFGQRCVGIHFWLVLVYVVPALYMILHCIYGPEIFVTHWAETVVQVLMISLVWFNCDLKKGECAAQAILGLFRGIGQWADAGLAKWIRKTCPETSKVKI